MNIIIIIVTIITIIIIIIIKSPAPAFLALVCKRQ
jgi:hypothetical protein